jgi:TonB family protein
MRALEAWIAGYLLNSLWQIPLVFAAGWIAAWLARPIGPRTEHRVWVGALFAEVALPLCRFQIEQVWPVIWAEMQSLISWSFHAHAPGDHVRVSIGPVVVSATGTLRFPGWMLTCVTIVYGTTLLYFIGRLVWGLLRTGSMMRESRAIATSSGLASKVAEYENLAGGSAVRFAVSTMVAGPVTVGILRRGLLFPRAFFESVNESELDAVLAHEFAHIRRRDFAKNLLYGIISLPAAYHPVLWLTNSRLSETREMICDEMAAEALPGRENYVRSLLRLASMLSNRMPANTLPAIGIFDANTFERRVMNLTRKRSEIQGLRRIGIIAACSLLAITAGASAVALRMDVNTPVPQNPKQIHVKADVLKYISQVPPVYPQEAKDARITGSVTLDVVINKQGAPDQIKVVKGPRQLQASALDAVKKWRWQPYLLNGEPIEVATTVTVAYSLGK